VTVNLGDIDLQWLLGWATLLSLGTLVAVLIAVPWVVARLPADYFANPRREPWRGVGGAPLAAIALGLAKNVLGLCLVLLGVLLLFTPGQGLLTLLAGLLLMNFPGKYRFERWLVNNTGVLKPLNWLRRRRGQEPFRAPAD
jgi:hypothetical protein